MSPKSEERNRGTRKLKGKAAVVTGGDSGMAQAVAIAFAREGDDVLMSYLSEDSDARETASYVEQAGQRAVPVRGDLSESALCRSVIDTVCGSSARSTF